MKPVVGENADQGVQSSGDRPPSVELQMRVPFDCSCAKTIAAQHLRAVRATHGDALAVRRARALAASLAYALMARRAVRPSQVAIGCRASSSKCEFHSTALAPNRSQRNTCAPREQRTVMHWPRAAPAR